MKKFFILFIALIVWGPPALKFHEISSDPVILGGSLDFTQIFQVCVWVFGAILISLFIANRLAHKQALIPSLLKKSPSIWYFLFGLFAIFSTLYSSSKLFTLFFAGKLIISILAVAFFFELVKDPLKKLMVIFFSVKILQFIVIALLYFIAPTIVGGPDGVSSYRLTGGIFQDFGNSALFTGLFLLTIFFNNKKPTNRFLALSGYVISWFFLLMSRTRTTTVVALFFLIAMIFLYRKENKIRTPAAICILLLILTVWSGYGDSFLGFATRDFDQVSTMTGRTVAFSYLIEEWWLKSPIIGYGYASGNRLALLYFQLITPWPIGSAHDALSGVLVDLGIIGATLLFVSLIFTWKKVMILWKRIKRKSETYPIFTQLTCLLVGATLFSFTSESFFGVSLPFLITMMGAQYICEKYESRSVS